MVLSCQKGLKILINKVSTESVELLYSLMRFPFVRKSLTVTSHQRASSTHPSFFCWYAVILQTANCFLTCPKCNHSIRSTVLVYIGSASLSIETQNVLGENIRVFTCFYPLLSLMHSLSILRFVHSLWILWLKNLSPWFDLFALFIFMFVV